MALIVFVLIGSKQNSASAATNWDYNLLKGMDADGISVMTDGNLNNYYELFPGRVIDYIFNTPVKLETLSVILSSTEKGNLEVVYLATDGNAAGNNVIFDTKSIENIKTNTNSILIKKVRVANRGYSVIRINEIGVFPEIDLTPPAEVTMITETHDDNSITLYWKNPTNTDFSHNKLYKNGVFQAQTTGTSYTFPNLLSDTIYNLKVSTVDNVGNESIGTAVSIKTNVTPVPAPDVEELGVTATFKSVSLSWKIPNSDVFHHVNIYRKTSQTVKSSSIINLFNVKPLNVTEDTTTYNPMFQTNGTFWKDLTVLPETDYEYLVRTESVYGLESEGVIKKISTPEEPLPTFENLTGTKTNDGDFSISWDKPVEGKVKVLIEGQEYTILNASLKQSLIPKEDIKYDLFNTPIFTLIPISESGKEGSPVKLGGTGGLGSAKVPFGPTDLLQSAMGLLKVIAPILLLSLGIIFFRPIKNVVVKAVKNHRERKMYR